MFFLVYLPIIKSPPPPLIRTGQRVEGVQGVVERGVARVEGGRGGRQGGCQAEKGEETSGAGREGLGAGGGEGEEGGFLGKLTIEGGLRGGGRFGGSPFEGGFLGVLNIPQSRKLQQTSSQHLQQPF